MVSALVTPTACALLYDDVPPERYLLGQAHLAAWVDDVLQGLSTDASDDALATSTLDALRSCTPETLPAWDYGERS
ncbi:hypothetical protein GCM10025875_14220 [Litorihabitans aurantiacus]|uniref:Uncharacterized protein n=1 Tax=Litorihabitans aurantiacus TaxID=1930061 RepID=A0AA37XE49_9MICO|nr:hypothetical protein GCM10025875_14220 [Litorihabitans aurantiacus]